MNILLPLKQSIFGAGILLVAACGGKALEADGAKSEACRETPAAELSASGHGCALVAELRAVGDALASVTDQPSADRAAALLRRSGERLKALKAERLKLNDDPKAGAKGAMVGAHMPAASAASKKIVKEFTRIATASPQLLQTINAAMEHIEY